ncbi:MAG: hypothetical protein NC925_02760 [Candidatus Omnitrophica bacterium]|nr:hypothetical protein [Candidatus Omnitrophota bacterium]MCM8831232.1 hypothetical protein [Candidatus Omnitrophota bacterium]
MRLRLKGSLFLVIFVICLLSISVFAQTRKEIMEQLNQARKNFIAERDKLHDQNRILRINWHSERAQLYQQLKQNPNNKQIQDKLNEGVKKFLADKDEIYRKLEKLRKDWLKTRKELKERIRAS